MENLCKCKRGKVETGQTVCSYCFQEYNFEKCSPEDHWESYILNEGECPYCNIELEPLFKEGNKK